MNKLEKWGPMTVLIFVIAIIVVLVGAILVVTGDYDGEYRQWVDDLTYLAGAAGLLGIGRGILKGKEAEQKGDLLREPADVGDHHEKRDMHDGGVA